MRREFLHDGDAGAATINKKRLNDSVSRQLSQISYWRLVINLALMLLDMAMFVISVAIVLVSRNEITFYSARFKFSLAPVAYFILTALIWILCLHSSNVYHRHVMGDGYQLNVLIAKSAVSCWFVLCACHFVLNMYLKLTAITLTVLLATVLTMFERFFARKFIIASRKNGKYLYSTVLVGSPEGILDSLKMLSQGKQLNYRPVAVCPIRLNEATGMIEAETELGDFTQKIADKWGAHLMLVSYGDCLAERIVAAHAQTVMVTDVLHRFSDNFNAFALQMESMNLEIALTASAVEISGHETQIRNIQGASIMTIRLPQYSPYARICKRVFDIVVSLLAIILSSPIMLVVAALIKKEDGGPVFYTQERIGLRGKPFKIHKFRSMRVNADAHLAEVAAANGQEMGARVKIKKDPRITKIGHFIRKTSLDELPQFFDSLIGTMSVVGPRPQRQFEVDEYDQIYATRLLVKPGITGPWQVSGRNDLDEEESRRLDVNYVQNWSVLGDLVYVLRTIGVVLHPNGAY